MVNKSYLVSAIVSVYNCERFIAGCLEDLERQTIADKLEIVVVNTGSQQNEDAIIREFQTKYDNIVYIKTENRETLYKAWNIGIKASSGKYITNANSDDRHRKDAFEIMVNVLENEQDIDLVYADYIVTEFENETFENHTLAKYSNLPEFDRKTLLLYCYIGPQPMWRKALHEKFGYFDYTLEVTGDYEFWLRLSEKCNFKHIKEYLGLYFRSPSSLERRDSLTTKLENIRIRDRLLKNKNAYDKKMIVALKKKLVGWYYDLGYYYFSEREYRQSIKWFAKSVLSRNGLKAFFYFIAALFPYEFINFLRAVKRKQKIIICQK